MKKLFLILAAAGLLTGCTTKNTSTDNSSGNKARMQQFYDEVINGHNVAMLDSFCEADFVDHNPDPGHSGKGIDDLKANFTEIFTAHPDIHVTTNFMIAEGDTVMSHVTMSGTNSGPMGTMPPTGKQFNIDGIDCVVIKDGKAVERWGFFDFMKMMTQLGMMPSEGAPSDTSKISEQEKK